MVVLNTVAFFSPSKFQKDFLKPLSHNSIITFYFYAKNHEEGCNRPEDALNVQRVYLQISFYVVTIICIETYWIPFWVASVGSKIQYLASLEEVEGFSWWQSTRLSSMLQDA